MDRHHQWHIGKLIPAIIALALSVDVTSRFFPIDALAFRSWEALIRYPAPCGLFHANAAYENPASYGDLAAVGNLPQYRQYRHEVFSTDKFGFRQNSNKAGSETPYKLVTVGDSFVFGLGLNDNQTLAAQLERGLGVAVYNGAASTKPATFAEILPVIRQLNLDKATVLYEYFQEHELPGANYLFESTASRNGDLPCQALSHRVSIWYRGFMEISPLQIFAQQTFKKLQNDWLLPNVFRAGIVVKTLMNGDPILFSPGDVKMSRAKRAVDVAGFKELTARLQDHDLRLVILLIPTKYTVYRPLLNDDDGSESVQDLYLNRLEHALRQANISVVNLLPRFRQAAQEYHRDNKYIYWRDDMHWNATGVEIAVEEIRKRHDLLRSAKVAADSAPTASQ